ncbi:MAG: PEP/pyruvate-binding domain-containing protein [Syntrophomonas sp.]
MGESSRVFLAWPEAFQAGAPAAGGKGWNLGRLDHYRFKIPLGGVLTAEVYKSYLLENKLTEDIKDIERSISIDNIENRNNERKLHLLREKMEVGKMPEHIEEELVARLQGLGLLDRALAVRSSATAEDSGTASFAGIHDSFLNVSGRESVLSAIKGCYASLWTPRALAYRRKMNIKDDEILQAVVILEMVDAQAAGVGFSCDPRSGREDITVISANFGLGESLVGGAVESDEYCLNYWVEIVDKKIGSKQGKTVVRKEGGTDFVKVSEAGNTQALGDDQIQKLGLLIQRVFDSLGGGEKHYDIEWVFDGRDFLLVQARPVTALPRYTFAELKNQPDIWSNANFSDTMPMVQSTLNWNLYKRYFELPGMPGYQMPPGLQGIRLYQGRAYVNLSIQQWYMYDSLGFTPAQTNQAWGGHQPEIEIPKNSPYAGIKGLKRLFRLLKFLAQGSKGRKNVPLAFPKVEQFTNSLLQQDLRILSERDLLNKLDAVRQAHREYYPAFLGSLAAADTTSLIKALERYFPGRGKIQANALMAGSGDITSAQQGYRLVEMAEIAREDPAARRFFALQPFTPQLWEEMLPEDSPFKRSLRSFLAEYGHRAVYELEILNPRWREEPAYLLEVVKDTMETADLAKIRARQRETAERAWREVGEKVPGRKQSAIKRMVDGALQGMAVREMAKSLLVKIGESNRLVFQEIARRMALQNVLVEAADIYHCSWSEIVSILQGEWDGSGLDILVAERKERKREWEALSPPGFIIDEVPQFAEIVIQSSAEVLTGLGVAAGKASGMARLIGHPHQGEKLKTGDVLVAPTTDPGWTPLFLRASAIIVETGGAGSHGAIVAREYGIPAVVNIGGAMKLIKDGQKVVVDGDEGKVFLH